jgi:hypothetical protein
MIANFTISNWGINAVNIAADYNGQRSSALYTAVGSLKTSGEPDMLTRIKDVMEIPELRDRLEVYTATKLQEENFAYNKDNLLKCWGILALFSLAYALIGLVCLEFVDKDKR